MSSLEAIHNSVNSTSDLSINESLQRFISECSHAADVEILKSHRLSGGAIQENWLIEVLISGGPWNGAHQWVLRTDAQSALPASLSRSQEFDVLEAAFQAGVKVPRPLWLCADEQVIGRVFFLMELVSGTAAGHLLTRHVEGEWGRLAFDLGANLARLHTVHPPSERLSFLSVPSVSPALAAVNSYRGFLDSLGASQPALELGLRWCEQNAPCEAQVSLVHRDYRTGNYLADASGLQAVLDWEFAGWGDPREDIGWFCAPCWRFARRDLEAGGIGTLEEFLSGYRSISPLSIDRDQLVYWQVMATIRWAVIALQQARRHTSGEEPSLELALTGRLVPELELDILKLISGSAI